MKVFITFFTILMCCKVSAIKDTTSAIYGGKPVSNAASCRRNTRGNQMEFKYHVQILDRGEHMCGGALIERHVILTAAHCFLLTPVEDIKILAGTYKKQELNSSYSQVRDALKVVAYPDFDMSYTSHQANDIALVFVKHKFELTPFVGPIIISMGRPDVGQDALMIGIGRTDEGLKSDELLIAGVNVLSKEECFGNYYKTSLARNCICVISKNRKCGTGTGDSGSPLIKIKNTGEHKILGVSSFGIVKNNKTDTNRPSIYTDVRKYHSWIKKNIKKNKCV